jgi:hypothetical protein
MKKLVVWLIFLLPVGVRAAQDKLEAEAFRLRDASMNQFMEGKKTAALKLNRDAFRITRRLSPTNVNTIENYDDAGLYYYDAGKWREAAKHQAIAVLLACRVEEVSDSFPAYVERLSWTFAKYRPTKDFQPVADNPLILLSDVVLDLRSNSDVRRRFFTAHLIAGPRSNNGPNYVYKLRRELIFESCYLK